MKGGLLQNSTLYQTHRLFSVGSKEAGTISPHIPRLFENIAPPPADVTTLPVIDYTGTARVLTEVLLDSQADRRLRRVMAAFLLQRNLNQDHTLETLPISYVVKLSGISEEEIKQLNQKGILDVDEETDSISFPAVSAVERRLERLKKTRNYLERKREKKVVFSYPTRRISA